MNRRLLTAALAATLLGLASAAQALALQPFQASTLSALQEAGKPVAVHFHADWCSTCVSQQRVLEQLRAEEQLKDITVLVADFDKERELRRQHSVRSQSVLIVFKGSTEVARSAGQTRPEQLRQALAKAL